MIPKSHDHRRALLVHGATYRREMFREKPEPFSLTNWLCAHPRIVCALLCASILISGQLNMRLP